MKPILEKRMKHYNGIRGLRICQNEDCKLPQNRDRTGASNIGLPRSFTSPWYTTLYALLFSIQTSFFQTLMFVTNQADRPRPPQSGPRQIDLAGSRRRYSTCWLAPTLQYVVASALMSSAFNGFMRLL